MFAGNRLAVVGMGLLICGIMSCVSAVDFLSPEFLSLIEGSQRVANLPTEAPGLLVSVENRTDRLARIDISYRQGDTGMDNYVTYMNPGDKSGQMLICPITEITIGNLADLNASGAAVALIMGASLSSGLANIPFLEVQPFGTILREGVNYDCGDEILFVIQPSGSTVSGYQTVAFIRRAN